MRLALARTLFSRPDLLLLDGEMLSNNNLYELILLNGKQETSLMWVSFVLMV